MENIQDNLFDFYDGEVPGYIQNAGKSFITILADDWDGSHKLKITLKEVIRYYAHQAGGFAGIRSLAGHAGDWRMIDNLAKELLEWFKFVNRDMLAREGEKLGMTLK